MIKTIGYFGGAFNPPHMGHLLVATYFRAVRPDAKLLIAPSARHPYGKQMAPFADRLQWCELLAKRVGRATYASDIEQRTRGLGRTLHVVRALRRELGQVDIVLIVGADNYDTRAQWYKIDELEKEASFFVLGRGLQRDAKQQHLSMPDISSTELRARLAEGQSCDGLIPADILRAVNDGGFYRPAHARRIAATKARNKR